MARARCTLIVARTIRKYAPSRSPPFHRAPWDSAPTSTAPIPRCSGTITCPMGAGASYRCVHHLSILVSAGTACVDPHYSMMVAGAMGYAVTLTIPSMKAIGDLAVQTSLMRVSMALPVASLSSKIVSPMDVHCCALPLRFTTFMARQPSCSSPGCDCILGHDIDQVILGGSGDDTIYGMGGQGDDRH
eukprot:scaffold442_cov397-Prasinococcus_capsulatus_cf.AAC.55